MIYTINALDEQFQQVMETPLRCADETVTREALHALMGELLAHKDLKYDMRLQNMLLACRLRLRALQNMSLASRQEEHFFSCCCELREYTEDLCAAADLLLAPLGRGVSFKAAEIPMECLCVPRDYGWLVLELICNCVLHCAGEEIEVTLELRGGRQRHCVLTVACGGTIDLRLLHAAAQRETTGAAAMLRTAWLHHGALLWLNRGGSAVATLRIAGSRKPAAESNAAELPDCVELLSDPCSLVYTALSPAIASLGNT